MLYSTLAAAYTHGLHRAAALNALRFAMGRKLALLILIAALCAFAPESLPAYAAAQQLRVGIVGKVSAFDGSRRPTSADDLILSMICDSLYEHSAADGTISPRLAAGWPAFDQKSGTVRVTLSGALDPAGKGNIRIDTIMPGLSARIPADSGIRVSFSELDSSITFTMKDDLSAFWSIFAFAPLWAAGPGGTVEGAGSPAYSMKSVENGSCTLSASSSGALEVFITGYPDESSMLAAYSQGLLDYIKTGLPKPAASVRGISWQSDAPAVITLIINPKSAVFSDIKARSVALSSLDVPYMVLRALQGNATVARGMYFPQAPPSVLQAQPDLLSGKKVSLLVGTTERSSLEMLSAMMIESWLERKGASVSIVLPKTAADLASAKKVQSYDAMVASVWLQPAFRGLIRDASGGSAMPSPAAAAINGDVKAWVDELVSPASFASLKASAQKLEAYLLSNMLAMPLIRPVVSEIYRPEALGSIKASPGNPILSSLRDISGAVPQ